MSSMSSMSSKSSMSSMFNKSHLLKTILQKHGYILDELPNKLLNYEIGKLLFSFSYMFRLDELYDILIIDEEICKLAVSMRPNNLEFVPSNRINEEICKLACEKDGLTLKLVPINIINEEICKLAVKNTGNILEYVPKNIINEEICKLAVQQYGLSIIFVPLNILNKEICKLAVMQNGWALEYISTQINKHLIDEEIWKLAVKNNPYSVNAIKEDINLLEEISIFLVSQDGKNIKYLKYKNTNIINCAVRNNGTVLKYLLPSQITQKICELAIEQTKDALEFVPKEIKKQLGIE